MRTLAVLTVTVALLVAAACSSAEPRPEVFDVGRRVYGDVCSACHGGRGEGGIGPSLDEVTVTWPSCPDHIEWIRLGSDGWRAQRGPTYGATSKPVAGGMPSMMGTLSDQEIAAAAMYERSEFAGVALDTAIASCGITSDPEP